MSDSRTVDYRWSGSVEFAASGSGKKGISSVLGALQWKKHDSKDKTADASVPLADTSGWAPPVRRKESFITRYYHRIDQWLAMNGKKAQFLGLFVAGACLQFFWGSVWAVFAWRYEGSSSDGEFQDPRPREKVSPFIEGLWVAWTFMSDGGTHARVYHAEQRFLGGVITASGILYLNIVLAVVIDVIRERLMTVRMGTGTVIEQGHIVILNWSDKTIPVLMELCMANAHRGGGVLVVLAKESVSMMQTELDLHLPKDKRYGTLVLLRFGDPAVVSDLIKVRADRAAAVIILASMSLTKHEADSASLRTVLSLRSTGCIPDGHFVCEVLDVDNMQLISLVGRGIVEAFVSHDMLGRLMLMSVRQPGLVDVWDELLGFHGNEFYVKNWPELAGVTFGSLSSRFPSAVPVGIFTKEGHVLLNPEMDITLAADDMLVVIAEHSDSYAPTVLPIPVEVGEMPTDSSVGKHSEKILICGWRRDIRDILKVLNHQSTPGSEVHIMTHSISCDERDAVLIEEGLDASKLQNIKLYHIYGNTSVRRRLEALPLETFTSCLIFADEAYDEDTMQADSHSLATLVLIRDIQASRQKQVDSPMTCEVLDGRTHRTVTSHRNLRQLADFVQSNQIVARVLAMVSIQRRLKPILSELLGPVGNNVYMMPSSWVVRPGEEISFWTVSKRVALCNATLIGVQEIGDTSSTYLNPVDKERRLAWDHIDLVVIAGNRRVSRCELFGLDEASLDKDYAFDDEPVRSASTVRKSSKGLCTGDAAEVLQRRKSVSPRQELVALPEAAMIATVKLATKTVPLLTDAERERYGSELVRIGDLIKSNFLVRGDAYISQSGASTVRSMSRSRSPGNSVLNVDSIRTPSMQTSGRNADSIRTPSVQIDSDELGG